MYNICQIETNLYIDTHIGKEKCEAVSMVYLELYRGLCNNKTSRLVQMVCKTYDIEDTYKKTLYHWSLWFLFIAC